MTQMCMCLLQRGCRQKDRRRESEVHLHKSTKAYMVLWHRNVALVADIIYRHYGAKV